MTELSGAVLLAQLRRLDHLSTLRANENRLKCLIAEQPRRPCASCPIPTATSRRIWWCSSPRPRCAQDLRGSIEGVADSGWHIYTQMEHLLARRTASGRGVRSDCAQFYPEPIEYRPGMLPRTEDIVGRSMSIGIGVADPNLGRRSASRSGMARRRSMPSRTGSWRRPATISTDRRRSGPAARRAADPAGRDRPQSRIWSSQQPGPLQHPPGRAGRGQRACGIGELMLSQLGDLDPRDHPSSSGRRRRLPGLGRLRPAARAAAARAPARRRPARRSSAPASQAPAAGDGPRGPPRPLASSPRHPHRGWAPAEMRARRGVHQGSRSSATSLEPGSRHPPSGRPKGRAPARRTPARHPGIRGPPRAAARGRRRGRARRSPRGAPSRAVDQRTGARSAPAGGPATGRRARCGPPRRPGAPPVRRAARQGRSTGSPSPRRRRRVTPEQLGLDALEARIRDPVTEHAANERQQVEVAGVGRWRPPGQAEASLDQRPVEPAPVVAHEPGIGRDPGLDLGEDGGLLGVIGQHQLHLVECDRPPIAQARPGTPSVPAAVARPVVSVSRHRRGTSGGGWPGSRARRARSSGMEAAPRSCAPGARRPARTPRHPRRRQPGGEERAAPSGERRPAGG